MLIHVFLAPAFQCKTATSISLLVLPLMDVAKCMFLGLLLNIPFRGVFSLFPSFLHHPLSWYLVDLWGLTVFIKARNNINSMYVDIFVTLFHQLTTFWPHSAPQLHPAALSLESCDSDGDYAPDTPVPLVDSDAHVLPSANLMSPSF